jgi:hypothetical protein
VTRLGLWTLAGVSGVLGVWALVWPHGFYVNFPWPGRHWVSMLQAYNEHVLRDFGGLNLAFAVMFAMAAVRLDRLLTSTLLTGYLCFAVPHLLFHLFHLRHFGTFDAIGQIISLATLVVLPVTLLLVDRRT